MGLTKKALNLGIWLSCMYCVSASVSAQTTEQAALKLTREQLVKSAKVYFRDTTEFPMTQNMTFSVFDSAGRVRQVKKQPVDYVFNGYNPGKKTASGQMHGKVSFWSAMRGNKMAKATLNSMLWTCGPSEFQMHDDLSFHKFVFGASGLPVSIRIGPLGKSTLQRYHVEVEFQRIMLAGDKDPFLVPRQVTATLETDKGKLVISSEYAAKKTYTSGESQNPKD